MLDLNNAPRKLKPAPHMYSLGNIKHLKHVPIVLKFYFLDQLKST